MVSVLLVVAICIAFIGSKILYEKSEPHANKLPRKVDRNIVVLSPKVELGQGNGIASTKHRLPHGEIRSYVPKNDAEWKGWKKAADTSVPISEVFVSAKLHPVSPGITVLLDGTVALPGVTSIDVEAEFTIADGIPSVPAFAYLQLIEIMPTGRRRVVQNKRVDDLACIAKRYTVPSTTLVAGNAGVFSVVLRTRGRDLAELKIRFE